MKLTHVVILALAILLGCGLIAASNLLLFRHEYSNVMIDGHLARSGTVEVSGQPGRGCLVGGWGCG
jgi:hypothetical protein